MEAELADFVKLFYSANYNETVMSRQKLKKYTKNSAKLKELCKSCIEYETFNNETKIITKLIELLLDSGWLSIRLQDSILIETKKFESDLFIKVKFEINANPIFVFSVLYETEQLSR